MTGIGCDRDGPEKRLLIARKSFTIGDEGGRMNDRQRKVGWFFSVVIGLLLIVGALILGEFIYYWSFDYFGIEHWLMIVAGVLVIGVWAFTAAGSTKIDD